MDTHMHVKTFAFECAYGEMGPSVLSPPHYHLLQGAALPLRYRHLFLMNILTS